MQLNRSDALKHTSKYWWAGHRGQCLCHSKPRLHLSKACKNRTDVACLLISLLWLSCLTNISCWNGLSSTALQSGLNLQLNDNIWWMSFPIFLKALTTFSNSWGSSRCPSINTHFLLSPLLTHFPLQTASRKVRKLKYAQWTRNLTCGACDLLQGNGSFQSPGYGGPCSKHYTKKYIGIINYCNKPQNQR